MNKYKNSIIKLVVFFVMAIIVFIWTPRTHEPVRFIKIPKNTAFSVIADKINVFDGLSKDAKFVNTLYFGDKINPVGQSSLYYKMKIGVDKEDNPIYGYVKKKGFISYNPSKKHIALTFDDGPNKLSTPIVLKALKDNGCRATFFVVGKMLDRKGSEILKQEDMQGCEIGNHSYSHPLLTDLKKKKIIQQLYMTDKRITEAIGKPPRICRAPYGGFNRLVLNVMKRSNIYWSIDTLDWKTKNSNKTLKAIRKNAKDGDIVLMHDIHMTTVNAVDRICKFLRAKNFETVTVTELASIQGVKLVSGKNYTSFKKKIVE